MRKTIRERFEEKYIPVTESGCWLWTASRRNGCEYGQMHMARNNRPEYAHRISWELLVGPIPDGLQVLHRCDVRSCVNPDHLYVGTISQNMQDSIRRGGHQCFKRAANQNCKRGHLLLGDNLRIYNGNRHCAACDHIRYKARRLNKQATSVSVTPI